ncbi:hypothetical protein [Fusobacterium sp.]|uniref:hypothetical protein n=1 Tax=Fusobacterium sp. TaxID=68766 RepID=UPI0025C61D71|nr:hypothetical protein [Fusobacterium sp.]MCI5725788.1 hypothetical protein [Fusobacterium sp.]MCI7222880.1 hypothetical protein [Fusobacterium sp.]
MKSYIKYLLLSGLTLILTVFLLNLGFVGTDLFAGKNLKIGSLFYSTITNENWLAFFGSFISGFAAFLLFFSNQKSLEHEKNKVKYENKMKKFENEKNIIFEYLSRLEINKIYSFLNDFQKIFCEDNTDKNELKYKCKKAISTYLSRREKLVELLNLIQLKLDVKTTLRENTNFALDKKQVYDNLINLRKLFEVLLEEVHSKIEKIERFSISEKEEINEIISILFDIKINKNKILDIVKDNKNLGLEKIINKEEKEEENKDEKIDNFNEIFEIYLKYTSNSIVEYFSILEKSELDKLN